MRLSRSLVRISTFVLALAVSVQGLTAQAQDPSQTTRPLRSA